MTKPLGIYLHLPFCVERCIYCDFLTFPHADKHQEPYLEALVEEIHQDSARRDLAGYVVDSIFLGGGTPSLLEPDQLDKLFAALHQVVTISPDCEVTIEANPATLDETKVAAYRRLGINRVSLGIQSMNQDLLTFCLRNHKPADVVEDIALLRRHGIDNINFDLIYAIPKQTEADIKADLKWIEKLQPGHVSWYSLIIEEKTLLHHYIKKGLVKPLDEDTEFTFMGFVQDGLESLGYAQYENSNYAKPGKQSRHNLKYWSNQDYWGLGLGASSYLGGDRYQVTSSFTDYLDLVANKLPTWQVESRTPTDDLFEQVMMGFRKVSGISRPDFQDRNGVDLLATCPAFFTDQKARGLIDWDDQAVWLTKQGFRFQNDVLVDFLIALEEGVI